MHIQLLIALEYKTVTKLMLSSSTLVKYANYLIAISININENYRSKRKFAKKEIIISQNSFTQLFNIQMTKFGYSWILMKILEMIDNSQKKKYWVYLQNS